MKEERFRQLFGAFGTLTDCSLKFTKDGKFRKFGFIGFKSEEEAQRALGHLHKSFVDTSRITVSRHGPGPACLSKVTTRSFLHTPVPFQTAVSGVSLTGSQTFMPMNLPGSLLKQVPC